MNINESKENSKSKWSNYILTGLVVVSFVFLFLFIDDILDALSPVAFVNGFIVTFTSILLEALPFLLIGCIVSAVLEVYIPESVIARFIPRNKLLGVLVTSLLGIIFPVCECATVPIVRRLRKKGMPLYIAITFMVAVPIINPTVILSTSYAFWDRPLMIILRVVCGLTGAVAIGLVVSFLESKKVFIGVMKGAKKKKKKKGKTDRLTVCAHEHSPDVHNHGDHNHGHEPGEKNFIQKIPELFTHAAIDLYDTGRYFILGAFLASLLHYIIPTDILMSMGQNKFLSLVIMGVFAFVLSVCSEADAFIARKFVSQFTSGSLVVFLILGPMIDIKNTLMLLGTFKTKFVIILGIIIFIVCIILGMVVNYTPIGGMV
jgi:uncharacterized protein